MRHAIVLSLAAVTAATLTFGLTGPAAAAAVEWPVVTTGDPGYELRDTALISPSDAWIVGGTLDEDRPVTRHFDGTRWTDVPVPGTVRGLFRHAAASGPGDVWATGLTPFAQHPLTAHWNGKTWRRVPVPAGAGSVDAGPVWTAGPRNAWMIDGYDAIDHWNGTRWTHVWQRRGYELFGVTGTGPRDVWAVGTKPVGLDDYVPISLHWNGSRWREVALPPSPPGAGPGGLSGVSAVAPSDVWASGGYGGADLLVVHWDGHRWTAVPDPPSTATERDLDAIAARAHDDVWTLEQEGPDGGVRQPRFLHWDGTAWREAAGDVVTGEYEYGLRCLPRAPGRLCLATGEVNEKRAVVHRYTGP